eukprot:jgi/Bigna1/131004/aug1.13_g5712
MIKKRRIETLVTSLRCVDFIAGPRCGVLRFSKSDISKRAADNDNTSWKARVQDAARIFEKVVLVVQNDHKRSEAYIAKMGDSPSYHRNIANLTATPGIAVMYSDDPKHSAELIYSICITEQRHLKERIELSKELKSGDCSLEKEIQFLCSIPGVHYVHALSLLTEFKFCLRDALNAPLKILEERMRKHLMSPMKSRKFYEFVRRDYDKSMLLKNLPS